MLPKFLGIGAQKAGTTWLHMMLSAHDEIWLPHVKELHYFDRKFPLVDHRRGNVRTRGYDRVAKHLKVRIRKLSIARIKDRFSFRRWPDLKWEMRYLFGDLTDEWYASLFDGAGTRVPGEITPAYSCLSEQAIKDVYRLIPEARLVLLLRDPIERAWSHAKMDLAPASKQLGQTELDRCFVAHFSGAASRLRGDYVGMIDRWLSVFPADQLLVCFYDEIVDAPKVLLGEQPAPYPRLARQCKCGCQLTYAP
jgi:hypothetical protein